MSLSYGGKDSGHFDVIVHSLMIILIKQWALL